MGSTYLKLTNKVLKRLNEVQLDSSNFEDVLGIHAAAKDSIIDTLQKINTQKFEWPFNAVSGTQLLTVGQNEYDWPADYKVADWESFYIEKDDALNIKTRRLRRANKDEWYKYQRETDFDAGADGVEIPTHVFRTTDGWGVTPSPDEAYTVNYKYFKHPTELALYSDECTVPSQFDYVIISGAMWYMYLWRENEARAPLAEEEFLKNLQYMTTILVTEHTHMTAGKVNPGGHRYRTIEVDDA